jgi:hypothetical protein
MVRKVNGHRLSVCKRNDALTHFQGGRKREVAKLATISGNERNGTEKSIHHLLSLNQKDTKHLLI